LEAGAYADLYDPATDSSVAVDYLASRGISPETAQRLDLRFDVAPEKNRDTGQWTNVARVIFPVRDRHGSLFGFTGRAVDPRVKPKVKDYFGLPKAFVILGEEHWKEDRPKIIVEGLFAYAHLVEIGMLDRADIGVLLGSAMTEHKANRIIHADCPTYLLLDNDAGGDLGLFGTINRDGSRETNGAVHYLEGHIPLFIPEWPEGKDDPDQLTREEVDSMLDNGIIYDSNTNSFDKELEIWV